MIENLFYTVTLMIWETLSTQCFNAVFASMLALFWWHHTMEGLVPGYANPFVHLIPVCTVILALSLLGERLFAFHTIGIGLVAIGLFLTTMLEPKEDKPK